MRLNPPFGGQKQRFKKQDLIMCSSLLKDKKYLRGKMYKGVQTGLKTAVILVMVGGCSGPQPGSVGAGASGLKGCPKRANCVSSEAKDKQHSVAPFRLQGNPDVSWPRIRDTISAMPRWRIVAATDTYIHAECKSRVFGFVDDLELLLNLSNGVISIRSASRIGYSDLGANRRRVELLRQALKAEQVIE